MNRFKDRFVDVLVLIVGVCALMMTVSALTNLTYADLLFSF
ncbi:hypothetical protein SAMN05421734_10966 [Pelagirhabdus alkalitolerans]|uniref:Uncharacterized protein n=1 Tax=Pelagirhabdus alkalitolerans TaxID=1612202 RepID=A0A1G6LTL7_9BACI|nr:hypothetical protein SAMN05421734_10966 [Pelagirhabdus alkalitolerans]